MQQQWRSEKPPAMTFDEVSMERSKSFVKALQELKNLRPQLYSAAEYCEKSYLHNEQKQMVLDNLKDYAVRALVNAVDHLGTVAYKLTDLFEQQTLDISTVELKVSCLNQQILTCQTYTDKEGLRQQQVSVATPRLHKHYILPSIFEFNNVLFSEFEDSASKRFQNIHKHSDVEHNHIQAKPHPYTSGTPASKTLSWLLASEDNCAQVETPSLASSIADSKTSKRTYETFHLMDVEQTDLPMPFSPHLHSPNGPSLSNIPPHTFDLKVPMVVPKPLSAFRSFDNPGKIGKREIYIPPAGNKSMLSAFFAKHKSTKPRKTYAT